jgi:hypothetical protein
MKIQGKEERLVLMATASMLIAFVAYSITTNAMLTQLPPTYTELNVTEPLKIIEDNITKYIFELTFRDGTGKNLMQFPIEPNLRASQLLALLPESDAVSYFDAARNKTVGYVKAFGGIGKNFLIEANKTYEISVTESVNWTFAP